MSDAAATKPRKTPPGKAAVLENAPRLWAGVANAWECDEYGHWNVRSYMARASEGFGYLLGELGAHSGESVDATSWAVPRDVHIRYLAEARPGARLNMRGGVAEMTETGIVAFQEMRHADGRPAATFRICADHVAAGSEKPFAWPQRIREAAKGLMVEIPEHGRARGLDLDKAPSAISLARALELDAPVTARGQFRPGEIDASGRVRPGAMIGRGNDAGATLFADALKHLNALDIGVAMLEMRVAVRRTPKAGDRLTVHSGVLGVSGKIMRVMHWALDPDTGGPWFSMEGAIALLDLKARKAVAAPEGALDVLKPVLRPKMSL